MEIKEDEHKNLNSIIDTTLNDMLMLQLSLLKIRSTKYAEVVRNQSDVIEGMRIIINKVYFNK